MSNAMTTHLTVPDSFSRDQIVEFNDLFKRTNKEKPHPDDVLALRRILADNPSLWQELGDLTAHALKRVAQFATPQAIGHESILLTAAELRRSLTLPTDTPIEGLLIEQCLTASLLHSIIQMRYINAQERGLDPREMTAWENQLSGSQRRLLRALESLVRLRNLSQPLMQINIAKTQTNIATTASPTVGA